MTEEQKFVLKLCPKTRVVCLDCMLPTAEKGKKWVGSLRRDDGDNDLRYWSVIGPDEVWKQLKRRLDFLIMIKLEQ
jgi:hypothetical protein